MGSACGSVGVRNLAWVGAHGAETEVPRDRTAPRRRPCGLGRRVVAIWPALPEQPERRQRQPGAVQAPKRPSLRRVQMRRTVVTVVQNLGDVAVTSRWTMRRQAQYRDSPHNHATVVTRVNRRTRAARHEPTRACHRTPPPFRPPAQHHVGANQRHSRGPESAPAPTSSPASPSLSCLCSAP